MAVKPLRKVFLPVNKFGAQSRESVSEIEAQYQSPNQMITFPAGLCSRRGADGKIHDLPWKKFVVAQAIRTRRHIVPLFFEAENSPFFYRMANWRKRLGIKFNAEMILLPGEMIKSSGSSYKIVVGKPISWDTLDAAHSQMARVSQKEANQISVRLELQADYFAGMWANCDNKMFSSLEDGDIEEGVNAASKIGDDYLQKKSQGYAVPDSFNHGTSAQRIKWLKRGVQLGSFSGADTFSPAYADL